MQGRTGARFDIGPPGAAARFPGGALCGSDRSLYRNCFQWVVVFLHYSSARRSFVLHPMRLACLKVPMRRRRWRLGPGLLALALAAAGMAAPGRAADMAPPAPSYYPPAAAPMPPAMYDWTGIYVGGHVGAGLIEDAISQSSTTATTADLAGSTNISAAGVIGGAQFGVNYQFASVVVGVEASFTGSDITGSSTSPISNSALGADHERFTSNPQWLAAATGRLGYAFNTVLLYVKGGGAYMHVNYTQDQLISGVTAATQNISDNRSGYTVGAGIEYGMTENLSAKLEYDFYDFGSTNYAFVQTPVSVSSQLHAITVGLNYRFNWANGSAVERCPTC
jgi:outer membrane immunogenic protein